MQLHRHGCSNQGEGLRGSARVWEGQSMWGKTVFQFTAQPLSKNVITSARVSDMCTSRGCLEMSEHKCTNAPVQRIWSRFPKRGDVFRPRCAAHLQRRFFKQLFDWPLVAVAFAHYSRWLFHVWILLGRGCKVLLHFGCCQAACAALQLGLW